MSVFLLDRVFHSEETTKNVYEEIAGPIISSAIQGYNGWYTFVARASQVFSAHPIVLIVGLTTSSF